MTVPRLDPRKQRTIEALLTAAERLFAEAAPEDVTVEHIAERAGVAVGSIYNNFGSKTGLYAAVVDRALDVDRQYMDRAYTPGRPPVEQLLAAAEQYLRFALDHPSYFRLLAHPGDLGATPAAAVAAQTLAARVDEQNRRMVDAIERGIADGSIRPVDPRRAATVLWASWNGIISLGWRPDALREDERGIAALLATAADVMGSGLRADRSGAPPA